MSSSAGALFAEISATMCICPCCGDVVWLSDTRLFLKGRKTHSIFDDLEIEDSRLQRSEERLDEREDDLREAARVDGVRSAKRYLKKIDPIFHARGIEPHDVKIIFDPVEYVVFSGMSRNALKSIHFIAHAAKNTRSEKIQKSLMNAIRKGNYEFQLMRVEKDGSLTLG